MLRDPSLIPLSRQHHNGLSLCVLTERSLRGDASAANIAKLTQKAIDRYEIELVNHFGIEERILFPAIDSPLISELIADHRRLEGMIDGLRGEPSAALLLEFTALLRDHIRREENVLFEEIQRRLPREKLDALGKEIDAEAVIVCI